MPMQLRRIHLIDAVQDGSSRQSSSADSYDDESTMEQTYVNELSLMI